MIDSLDRWLDMADGKLQGGEIPCILNGGNDDIWEIDDVIEPSPSVSFGEGKMLDLDGFHLVSMGWTNPTPWNTFREAPEEELAAKIEAVASQVPDMERAIFNFHAPPYGTGLDEAPALDATLRPTHGGAVMKPVGSTAVRDAIVRISRCCRCTDTSTKAAASSGWAGPSPSIPAASTATASCRAPCSS